eukprot:TRINITY_DN4038_c0_g1_i2.p1 TRINITY_DN4038_c0_g1~~TRINITY_DN4038_c0_g1_i2.p1  ORF type:complete len:345 (+),score=48.58 TRINITY_DN4038_c0_g1_i2:54-1088(+)
MITLDKQRLAIVLPIVLSIFILFGLNYFSHSKSAQIYRRSDEESWSLKNLVLKDVERIEWSPTLPFTLKLATMREPVVLTNTVVTTWKALNLWQINSSYLPSHPNLKEMKDVKIGLYPTMASPDFNTALSKIRSKLKLKDIPWLNYTKITMSGQDFFNALNDPSDGKYYYHLSRVSGSLKDDVSPSDFLWISDVDKENYELWLWLGGADIGPPLHYDMDHNFFVQISGRKRFILFPPQEFRNLHLYPRVHPLTRKSQVNFDHPNFTATPNYKNAKGLQVVLDPGEVLYLPPYWWHNVHAITPCVILKRNFFFPFTWKYLWHLSLRVEFLKLWIDCMQSLSKLTR